MLDDLFPKNKYLKSLNQLERSLDHGLVCCSLRITVWG